MRSTFAGFNTVVRGIFAQQASLDTVGHNIANANTDGYSRQNVNLSTTRPEVVYGGAAGKMQLGTGVTAQSVTRARDSFIDSQMWKESGALGYGQMTYDTLSRIEGIFKDTAETGMQAVLNKFWSAWQTLSTTASDEGTRTALRQRGVEMVDTIQHSSQQLKDVVGDLNSVIEIKVNKTNQINSEILSLNKQIMAVEAGGKDNANDLRDRRDLLVDQLSGLMKVQVSEDQNGSYTIQSNGVPLVSATSYTELAVRADQTSPLVTTYGTPAYEVIIKETGENVKLGKGEIQGMIDSRDDDTSGIKGYLDQLNTMSKFLLTDFNSVHRAGYGLDASAPDNTNNNFFGADTGVIGTPANGNWIDGLKVSSALFATSPANGLNKIAAKGKATDGDGSGDWAVKMSEALKTTKFNTLNNSTLDGYYNSLVGAMGVQTQSAKSLTENQKVLVNQVNNWRLSISGVNMDEEMTNMIRFQKGYNAASRVMTTIDEMLDKLINGTGVVGR